MHEPDMVIMTYFETRINLSNIRQKWFAALGGGPIGVSFTLRLSMLFVRCQNSSIVLSEMLSAIVLPNTRFPQKWLGDVFLCVGTLADAFLQRHQRAFRSFGKYTTHRIISQTPRTP